jgi:hypothetical protein
MSGQMSAFSIPKPTMRTNFGKRFGEILRNILQSSIFAESDGAGSVGALNPVELVHLEGKNLVVHKGGGGY